LSPYVILGGYPVRKRIRGRIILLVVVTLLTGYYIVPSVFPVESLPSLFPGLLPRAEKMNLGLDLQGGIHLVLEVQAEKAVENATDKIVAIDRQTTVEVDLTEQIAGKKALQTAAAAIAERMLPKLVKK
jgi:preprotein translocase subunit SecD